MAEKDVLVVVSKVKDYVKSKGMMTSADAVPALSEKVYMMIDEAIKRTKENGRQTIKPQDL
jgi:histone H3/H4